MKYVLITMILLILSSISLYLYSCGECTEDNVLFKKRLDKQLKRFDRYESDSLIFRLDSLTEFDWDKLYIISGNYHLENRDMILGFKWRCATSNLGGFPKINGEQDEFIFIFTKRQSVISYSYFRGDEDRYYFDAQYIGGHTYYTPETAIFKVIETRDNENRKLGYIELHDLVEQPANIQYFIDKGW